MLMKIIHILFFSSFLIVCSATRFCVWQTNQPSSTKQTEKKQQKIQIPYIISASQEIKRQIYQSAKNLLNKNQQFRSYHPHYLHSFSFPEPITPHLYIGQVMPNHHPIFYIQQNKTFEQYGETDHVNKILYINKHKQYEYPNVHRNRAQPNNSKFMLVLQNENMLAVDIPMQIVVINFDNYLGVVSNLGYGDFEGFIFYVSKNGQQAISLNYPPEDFSINLKNQSGIKNMRQTWMNAKRLRWTGRPGIKISEQSKIPLILSTLVIEIEYLSAGALSTYKVCLNQFLKASQTQTIEEMIIRMEKQVRINTYVYRFQAKDQRTADATCSSQAQNQLLMGLTYQYGTLLMKNGSNIIPNKPKQLLSFSPSRQRFPWGFLWDDGFHCQVAIRTEGSSQIALTVIKSWLDTITESGWIPRQQNRGEQRDQLCNCPAFMAKDVRDGNPPTLILPLHYLAKRRVLNQQLFGDEYYQKLKKWYNWFMETQEVKKGSYIFKWHDSIMNEGSFNSGMDDFPRLRNTYGHVDCQAWMYMFAQAMADISFSLDKEGMHYLNDAQKIRQAFQQNFIDPITKLPKDYEQSMFGQKTYSPHFGYPTILTIAFGLIDQSSTSFQALIKAIQSQLDSGQGLTSISMRSLRYLQNQDAYWKGPVWININYLFLKGLFQNYLSMRQYYKKLREDIITLVCTNLNEQGYFFENYKNGKGSFAYPFTGWTATISIIIKQSY